MKSFVGLSAAALSLAAIAAVACSSSSSPTSSTTTEDSGVHTGPSSDDAGNNQNLDAGTGNDANGSSNDSGPSSDAGCAPGTIADGGVPVFTAPAKLGQNLCDAADITAFVNACNSAASGSTCGTWAQGDGGTTACGACLFDETGSVIAPLEILKLGTEGEILPSIGACILANAGLAAAACAAAADENDYCVQDVCSACGASQTTFSSCATKASTSPCSTTALQGACSAYQSITESCITSAGSTATLTAAANAICGSGPDAG